MIHREKKRIDRVYELAAIAIDGSRERQVLDELEALLEGDSEARRAYLAFMQDSVSLRWRFGDFSSTSSNTATNFDNSQVTARALSLHRFLDSRLLVLAATLLVAVTAMVFVSLNGTFRLRAGIEPAIDDSSHTGSVSATSGILNSKSSQHTAPSPVELNAGEAVATLTELARVSWHDERSMIGELSRLSIGQVINFQSGKVKLVYDAGVEVVLTGPCKFEILSASSAYCRKGVIAARVGESGRGFIVQTPFAQVIDLGTEFGIQVDEQRGSADVVVFKGAVDLEYASLDVQGGRERRRLYMGEGANIDRGGTLSRIVSISSGQFGRSKYDSGALTSQPALITSVEDNIKRLDSMKFYEIVHAGMREDALAYVDRPEHQWNGITSSGMPDYLLGGDYVKCFNDDKVTEGLEVVVTVGRPASLFVLFDDRINPPDWLTGQFVDTGDDIGLDIAPYTFEGKTYTWNDRVKVLASAVGPGNSVDDVLSIWRRDVNAPREIRLSSTGAPEPNVTMYGIVAVPLIE